MLERMWRKGNTSSLLMRVPTCTATLEINMATPQENGDQSTQDPTIPLLGIYPKEEHSYNKDIYSMMFIEAPFVTARTWKQLRCPSTEE